MILRAPNHLICFVEIHITNYIAALRLLVLLAYLGIVDQLQPLASPASRRWRGTEGTELRPQQQHIADTQAAGYSWQASNGGV